jgi:hypothetical protein
VSSLCVGPITDIEDQFSRVDGLYEAF